MKETYKLIAKKKRLRKDTGSVCTTNPAGSRLRLEATSQLLQFGRSHPSHFYQLCTVWHCQATNDTATEKGTCRLSRA